MRKSKLVAVLLVLLVTGCEDRYRYFCQDPQNFETEQCKVNCKGDGTCPEDIYGEHLDG